jgi:ureidoglycolate dehydrogenase (NAD+)
MTEEVRIGPEALGRFVAAIFRAKGMTEADAAQVAEVLIWADLRGVDSHGVVRVPRYLHFIKRGDFDPAGRPRLREISANAFVLDCAHTAGPVAMMQATERAAAAAAQGAVAFGLVNGSTHIGAAGYYVEKAAARGLAAIVLAAGIPNMAYHGARTLGVATAPIAIAVPGPEHPLLLDMATAVAASGKLRQAIEEGRPIPEGWALDEAGNPTTDPAKAAISLPLGGPKGAGLALMFECLTGILAGAAALAPLLGKPASRHVQNAAIIALDVAQFRPVADFVADIAALQSGIKGLPRLAGVEEILLPGERGRRSAAERRERGIPLARALWDELGRIGAELGVAAPAPPTTR